MGESTFLIRQRTWIIASVEALLVCCGLVLAWVLRFDFTFPYLNLLVISAPFLIVIRLLVLWRFRLLHGWWRYTGIYDVVSIAEAVGLGSVIFFLLMRFVVIGRAYPRSVYILEGLITAGLLSITRLASRMHAEAAQRHDKQARKTIVIGAGNTAQGLIRELRREGSGYRIVGCVDDDATKSGLHLQGVEVLGTVDQLPRFAAEHEVGEVLIAIPQATGKQMRRFVEICDQAGLRFRTVPPLRDRIASQFRMDQLRDVDLEDLLSRDPVDMDLSAVEERLGGGVVMVTGAAGSIGSELCRQALRYQPAALICVDHDENGMVVLEHELKALAGETRIEYCVAHIGNHDRIRTLLGRHRPDAIFHAAAHKHVPVMEANPAEAIANNVFGMLRLLEAADDAGCRTFVFISSDKAVNPASVMGCTKRIGELIASSRPSKNMRCLSVRFGNVLGSSGSVVPLLRQQLRRNDALTITHPEIRRFFMTTREAVSLVLQTVAIGEPGDILVLNMGEAIRVVDLALLLASLSGKHKQDVKIEYIGLRPGEKLEEELFYASEQIHPSACEGIKRVRSARPGWPHLQDQLKTLEAALAGDAAAIRAQLRMIVPEFTGGSEGSVATQDHAVSTSA